MAERPRARLGGRWSALVVLLALAVLVVPMPASWVERHYAPAYPGWQHVLTPLFDWLPWAPFDVWLIVALTTIVAVVARAWRRSLPGRLTAIVAATRALLVAASVLYLWFMLAWGLNYRREPLMTRLDIARHRVTGEKVQALARRTIAELNRLHGDAWSKPWPDWREVPALLAPSTREAARSLGLPEPPQPGRPRTTLLQPYFRWAAIEGMTDPFLLDVVVNADLLPMERPAMVAHEWGHLAGLAREAEASFFGWRVCQAGDARAQYSAWLFIYGYVMNAVRPDARGPLMAALASGPRRDLRQIAARYEQVVPAVRDAAWLAYDRYLKSNRIPEGVASYDEVLLLILGGPSTDNQPGAGDE